MASSLAWQRIARTRALARTRPLTFVPQLRLNARQIGPGIAATSCIAPPPVQDSTKKTVRGMHSSSWGRPSLAASGDGVGNGDDGLGDAGSQGTASGEEEDGTAGRVVGPGRFDSLEERDLAEQWDEIARRNPAVDHEKAWDALLNLAETGGIPGQTVEEKMTFLGNYGLADGTKDDLIEIERARKEGEAQPPEAKFHPSKLEDSAFPIPTTPEDSQPKPDYVENVFRQEDVPDPDRPAVPLLQREADAAMAQDRPGVQQGADAANVPGRPGVQQPAGGGSQSDADSDAELSPAPSGDLQFPIEDVNGGGNGGGD